MQESCAYQFVHESAYAIKGARPRGAQTRAKRRTQDIISEAARVRSYCRHVKNPQAPRCLFGQDASDLVRWHKGLVRQVKSKTVLLRNGVVRAQRVDTPVLIATVASYPGAPDVSDQKYQQWLDLVIRWAKRVYGARLVSVLEHVDEPHGHVHIFAADEGNPVKPLMAGHAASEKARRRGASPQEQARAFKNGYRDWQDRFYMEVGQPCGLRRISPAPGLRISYRAQKAKLLRERDRQEEEMRTAQQFRLKQSEQAKLALEYLEDVSRQRDVNFDESAPNPPEMDDSVTRPSPPEPRRTS